MSELLPDYSNPTYHKRIRCGHGLECTIKSHLKYPKTLQIPEDKNIKHNYFESFYKEKHTPERLLKKIIAERKDIIRKYSNNKQFRRKRVGLKFSYLFKLITRIDTQIEGLETLINEQHLECIKKRVDSLCNQSNELLSSNSYTF